MKRYYRGQKCLALSRDEVRAFDAWAINTAGVPGIVLMENAARSCAELIKEKMPEINKPTVCVFCGTGNNGGDGFAVARHLRNSGFGTAIALCGPEGKVKGDAKINLEILHRLNYPIQVLDLDSAEITQKVKEFAGEASMIVDAIFGTGLTGQLNEHYQQLIEGINSLNRPVVSVDIPSGLDCDTGEPLGTAVRAAYTVTFAAMKKGFLAAGAETYTGEIYVADIGIAADIKP